MQRVSGRWINDDFTVTFSNELNAICCYDSDKLITANLLAFNVCNTWFEKFFTIILPIDNEHLIIFNENFS